MLFNRTDKEADMCFVMGNPISTKRVGEHLKHRNECV